MIHILAVNTLIFTEFRRSFGIIERRRDGQRDHQTDSQQLMRGYAGRLCYGFAEFAVLSLGGAASPLHNG